MAIKMRISKAQDATCFECGDPREKVLEMYDICVGGMIITICDKCNEQLFTKALKANCSLNAKLKSKRDLSIIRSRSNKKDLMKSNVSINEAMKDVDGED